MALLEKQHSWGTGKPPKEWPEASSYNLRGGQTGSAPRTAPQSVQTHHETSNVPLPQLLSVPSPSFSEGGQEAPRG